MTTATDPDVAAPPAPPSRARPPDTSWPRRAWRGRADDPRWVRPALLGLLAATARHLPVEPRRLGLGELLLRRRRPGRHAVAEGLAVRGPRRAGPHHRGQAAGVAVGHGAVRADLRVLSSWSMLAPQALMGVAAVGLLYLTVRRWSGPRTALAAGALLAATPVAVLMFRFNNPDAMLVLTMVAAATRRPASIDAAGRRAGTWWLVATGALVGLGLPHQAAPGAPRRPGARADGARRRAVAAAAPDRRPPRRRRGRGRLRRLVRRARRALARVLAPLHRRVDDQLAAPARARLQRPRPHPRRRGQPAACGRPRWRRSRGHASGRHGRSGRAAGSAASAARRASSACSRPSSPARRPGSCPRRSCCSSPRSGPCAARRAPTAPAASCCSAASGRSCTPWSSAR